jgi:hypothetical protein
MHRILMRTVYLDLAPDAHDAGLAFWQQALQAELQRGVNYPEYHQLCHPAAVCLVYVQLVNDGASHFHVDIESDDQPAEVARLVGLGARIVSENTSDTVGDWTVLRDPGDLLFCVTKADVDAEFDARAARVG